MSGQNTTFGTAWMHRWLIGSLRVLDVRLLYLLIMLVIMPVCLLINTNNSRTCSYRYFRKRMGYGRLKAAWNTYVNHYRFGQVVIDRFAMFAGRHFKVEVVGYEHFQKVAEQDEGFVQLSSHTGCYEAAGYNLKAKCKRFNALVYGGEKATVMEGRREQLDKNNIRMIPVQPDMSHLFLINEALANKETVSMPADRILGSPKTITVNFLGAKARLPMGPFSVATMRGMDTIAVNVMKTSTWTYTAYVDSLSYDKDAPRKVQMQQLADSYAAALERVVRRYPTQWFNFYDFWETSSTVK